MESYRARLQEKILDEERVVAKLREELQKQESLVERLKAQKGGRDADDDRAALVDELYNQGMRWAKIKEQVEAKFNVHTTVKALQQLRTRWLERQQRKK